MAAALRESIQTLVIASESDALVDVAQQASVLRAKLTLALAELDHRGDWKLDGSASMTAWVRNHFGWTNQAASHALRLGRRLRALPATAAAWITGELTDAQVEVIAANVTEARTRLWADHETELVPLLRPLDLPATAIALQTWAARADAVLDEPEPPAPPPAEASIASTLDGRTYLKGSFDAEGGETLATALRIAQSGDHEIPLSQRHGHALVDICRHFLDHQTTKVRGRHRPHLNIVITNDALRAGEPGRTLDGRPLPGLVVRQMACDATVHRVITDGASSILDYGRGTRTIPPALYTSLVLRDLGCRFPGCDRPVDWCEGHHIRHWEDGGATRLDNLVLLCSRHHHVIHQPDWRLELRPDGTIIVTEPTGRRRHHDPPGSAAVA
ncbi:MAG TPA: DUF222 domain-containing protein [Acidimicrobiales bacterium]|nr:DUF222 domain-containing protein [Acidimicrobiales bacterium]